MSPRVWTPNGVGILGVTLALIALFFLEPLTVKRSYQFSNPEKSVSPLKQIPLNYEFELALSGQESTLQNQKRMSLEKFLAAQKKPSKLLLINFWATWCDPCVEEIPSLNWLSLQLRGLESSGFPSFITVSVDDNPKAIFHLEKTLETRFRFPVFHDPEGQFSKTLGILKFPETFLVDSKGTILYKWIGPQDWQSQEIVRILVSFANT